jgi:CBS domain-containing protein
VAVTDEAGRFLGAVTIDDVLDRMLGAGWRTTRKRAAET